MEQNSNPSGLCKMGCGFYGNHSYEGMCSKCYKDNVKRQQQSSPTAGRNSPGSGSCGTAASMATPISSQAISTKPSIASPPVDIPTPTDKSCPPEILSTSVVEDEPSPSSQDCSLDENSGSPSKQKKRNRCYSCKKKVGLTGFECRCGGLFCGLHRYSDKHNCSFDYKTDGREQLAKANPVVVGEKIKKI